MCQFVQKMHHFMRRERLRHYLFHAMNVLGAECLKTGLYVRKVVYTQCTEGRSGVPVLPQILFTELINGV